MSTYMYESAIYFANISLICFYERNAMKIDIFRGKWHRLSYSEVDIYHCIVKPCKVNKY